LHFVQGFMNAAYNFGAWFVKAIALVKQGHPPEMLGAGHWSPGIGIIHGAQLDPGNR
jgi:hypothetical protein